MSGCAHMDSDDFCASCAGEKLVAARAEVERLREDGHAMRARNSALEADLRAAHDRRAKAEARLAKVVKAGKQLLTSIETIERQAEVLSRRVGDDRPVDTILFECRRVRTAFALAAAQPEEVRTCDPPCENAPHCGCATAQPEEGR